MYNKNIMVAYDRAIDIEKNKDSIDKYAYLIESQNARKAMVDSIEAVKLKTAPTITIENGSLLRIENSFMVAKINFFNNTREVYSKIDNKVLANLGIFTGIGISWIKYNALLPSVQNQGNELIVFNKEKKVTINVKKDEIIIENSNDVSIYNLMFQVDLVTKKVINRSKGMFVFLRNLEKRPGISVAVTTNYNRTKKGSIKNEKI